MLKLQLLTVVASLLVCAFSSYILASLRGENCLPRSDTSSPSQKISCQSPNAYYIDLRISVGALSTVFSILERAFALAVHALSLAFIARRIRNAKPVNIGATLSVTFSNAGSVRALLLSAVAAIRGASSDFKWLAAYSLPGPILFALLLYWQTLIQPVPYLASTSTVVGPYSYQPTLACTTKTYSDCSVRIAATNGWYRNETEGVEIAYNNSAFGQIMWDDTATPVLVPALSSPYEIVQGSTIRLPTSCKPVTEECHLHAAFGASTPYNCPYPNWNLGNETQNIEQKFDVIRRNTTGSPFEVTSRGGLLWFLVIRYNQQRTDVKPEWVIPVHGGQTALAICEAWLEQVHYVATQKSVTTSNPTVLPLNTTLAILSWADISTVAATYAHMVTQPHALVGDKSTYFPMFGKFMAERLLAMLSAPTMQATSDNSAIHSTAEPNTATCLPKVQSIIISTLLILISVCSIAGVVVICHSGHRLADGTRAVSVLLAWLEEPVHLVHQAVFGRGHAVVDSNTNKSDADRKMEELELEKRCLWSDAGANETVMVRHVSSAAKVEDEKVDTIKADESDVYMPQFN
ncbi:hypothetical protein HDV00_007002, partial [Rhizophlyctis rosea]